MLLISVSGNFGFFNCLGAALSIALLHDDQIGRIDAAFTNVPAIAVAHTAASAAASTTNSSNNVASADIPHLFALHRIQLVCHRGLAFMLTSAVLAISSRAWVSTELE